MAFESLRPVMDRGELVALAGRERFRVLAPWLEHGAESDPELRLVAMLASITGKYSAGEVGAGRGGSPDGMFITLRHPPPRPRTFRV